MRFILIIILGIFCTHLQAQSYAFGLKGGLLVGTQSWDGFERDVLFRYHGIAFIESAPEDNSHALFAQVGYHERGSAIRGRNAFFIDNDGNVRAALGRAQTFIFRNVSLAIGAKKKYEWNDKYPYYLIGVRGEYTISTNLDEYRSFVERGFLQYPYEEAVRNINYGVIAGGGLEFPITDLISGIVELTVNPDLSMQYNSPPFDNIQPPPNSINQNPISLRERRVTNTSLELTVGMRFMHKIVYVD